ASHSPCAMSPSLFFFTHTPPTEIYTLSLHDALPISIWPTAATRARALSRLPKLVFAFGLFMSGLLAVSLQLGRTVKANARAAEQARMSLALGRSMDRAWSWEVPVGSAVAPEMHSSASGQEL